MATFAALSGNQVNNIIVADTLEDAELVTRATCVEYTAENPASVGCIYDSETGRFIFVEVIDEAETK